MNKKLHDKNFITKFFLVLIVFCFSLSNVKATIYDDLQRKEVTINMQNKLVTDLLNEIQKQTNLNFVYNENELSSYVQKSLNVKNQSVETVLGDLFNGTYLTYKIVGNTITIVKKDTTRQTQQQPKAKFTVNGKVIEQGTKKPVVGATVIVLGTTIGAITDNDGKFEVKAAAGEEIEISFTGMIAMKITANATNNKNLIIEMKYDAVNVSDVIVTGIFNKAKESYTGSVTTVTAKDLKMFSGQNLLSTLKNIDPAFNVQVNNDFGSDPNRLPDVNIRGNSSLPVSVKELNENAQAQLNTPLIIMDGFPISLQKMMDFNDEEIETITILKDASATAIYGSRGANGVVVITTKAPLAGKLKIFVQASTNIEMPDLSSYNLMNATEKLALEKQVGFFESSNGEDNIEFQERYNDVHRDVLAGVDTYWLSKPVQVGVGQKYNLRLEGGSSEFRWSTSVSYNNIVGAMKGSDKSTFNGSINLSYNLKNVIFKNQTSVGITNGTNSPYGNFSQYAAMNPFWRTHDENGNLIKTYKTNDTYYTKTIANPLYDATLNTVNTTDNNDLTNNFSIEWNIIDDLKLNGRFGITKLNSRSDNFKPANHSKFENYMGSDYIRRGSYDYNMSEGINYDVNLTMSYSKIFAKKHQLYAGLDYSLSQQKSESANFALEGFTHPSLNYMTNALKYAEGKPSGSENISRRIGFTANLNYTYDNKYFTDFSFRVDGSSQFGSKNRFAPFFSAGLGWNLHNESFLKNSEVVNSLRLKGSYGRTGSQNFSPYQALTMYSFYTDDRYLSWNGAYLMGFGNEELKWQITDQYNVGTELGLWNNRLTASVDFYHKLTSSLLSQMDTQLSTGFRSYTDNVGSVTNTGIEAMLSGYIIRNTERELFWTVTTKLSYNKNKIKSLSDAVKKQNAEYMTRRTEDARTPENNNLMFEGDSQNSIYVVPSLGIDPSNGEEMFLSRDNKMTYSWDISDRRYAGISEPKFRGNISSMLTWKNLTLNVSFGMHWGGQQYNQTLLDKVEVLKNTVFTSDMSTNVDKRVLTERWINPGDVKPFRGLKINTQTQYSSRFVQDDNMFEMQSANLSYKLSNDWITKNLRLQSLTIGCNMSDIFYISTIKRERGIQYPFARRIGFNLSLMF